MKSLAFVSPVTIVALVCFFSHGSAFADSDLVSVDVTGTVVSPDGNVATNANVRFSLPSGKLDKAVKTDDDGKFQLLLEVKKAALKGVVIRAESSDGKQLSVSRFSSDNDSVTTEGIEIQLSETKEGSIQVLDANGAPVDDASVAVQLRWPNTISGIRTDDSGRVTFRYPETDRVNSVVAWKDNVGLDYRVYSLSRRQRSDALAKVPEFPTDDAQTLRLEGTASLRVRISDDSGQPIPNVQTYVWLLNKESESNQLNLSYYTDQFAQSTDENGEVVFPWIPAWQKTMLQVWPSADEFGRSRGTYDPATGNGLLEMQLTRLVPIRGKVTDPDGNAVSKITVVARGEGYSMDDSSDSATTDDEGNYELHVAPEKIYLVVVKDMKWAAAPQTGFAVRANEPVEGKDFVLREATRVYGTLSEEGSGEPISNQRVIVYQYGEELNSLEGVELNNPENSRRWVNPMLTFNETTDEQGHFEFALGDGSFDIRPPQQEKSEKFEIAGEAELKLNVTTVLRKEVELTGKVTEKETDDPVGSAKLEGVAQNFSGEDWQAATNAEGMFRVMRQKESTYVHVVGRGTELAAIAIVKPEQTKLEVKLEPTGSVTGRLLSDETKEPWADKKINYGVDVPSDTGSSWSTRFGDSVVTDEEGRFEIDGLVGGWDYSVNLGTTEEGMYHSLPDFSVETGEAKDLGDVQAPPKPKRYVPPTLEQRIAKAFEVDGTPVERLERAKKSIKLVNQHLLIVFGKPENKKVHRLMEIRYQDADFREVRDEFRFMAIPTDEQRRGVADALAKELDESIEGERADFLLVILNRDGKKVDVLDTKKLCNDDGFSKDKFIETLRSHQPKMPDARTALDDALRRANEEGKRVIVQETATWCGPCHLLSRFLDDNRTWEKDYVLVKMDHRLEGARELMKEIRDGAKGGIPWYAILDASGEKLATSNTPDSGENIGYPSSETGQSHFANMLNQTRNRMTKEDVNALINQLTADDDE
ncbi:Nickel uptake substrate-specific transmembrane region [Planctomycetes bacterium CA13]|uniref:Nickel uptake substrate-specific transmembrane region n=1 Tax=Novipirellula herctigrandis TaxID=2527986 RepID=A0A5C5Z7D6_9BACT|nr:Nickel uptake substrate-specific transmembrane region [Planctomycetes bacterium CA13]